MFCREGRLRWRGLRCRLHSAPGSLWKQGSSSLWRVAMTSGNQACHHQRTWPPGVGIKKKKEQERKHRRSSCCAHLTANLLNQDKQKPPKTHQQHLSERLWTSALQRFKLKIMSQISCIFTSYYHLMRMSPNCGSTSPECEPKRPKTQKSAAEIQVTVSSSECEVKSRGTALFRVSSVKGDRTDVIGGELVQPQPPDITVLFSKSHNTQTFPSGTFQMLQLHRRKII